MCTSEEIIEYENSKKLLVQLDEFLGFIFDAYDSSLTYNINRNYQQIEVSFRGFCEEPQYYPISYKFDNNKVYFETCEDCWTDIFAWNAKTDLVMHLFLRCCNDLDSLRNEL